MLEKMTIQPNESMSRILMIHPKKAQELKLSNGLKISLSFGLNKREVTIKIINDLSTNTVVLAEDVISDLCLPTCSVFDFIRSGTQIVIGPFLGILAASTNELLQKRLKKLSVYYKNYESYRGVLMVFSLESIQTEKQMITGFVYNPITNSWDKGTYGYPSAIYRKISLNKSMKKHLDQHLSNKVFNSDYLSKLEVYNLLRKNKKMREYLPKTRLYRHPNNIIGALENGSPLYVKPLRGLKGIGIKEITESDKKFKVRSWENNQNQVLTFNEDMLISYIEKNIVKNKYILQQRLNLNFEKGRKFDFRFFVSKNGVGEWKCLGWVAKKGAANSIVSNRSSGGKVKDAKSVLQKLFKLDQKSFFYWRKDLFELVCEAARTVEGDIRNFGHFAIDVGIDTDGNFWILEMNHRNPNDQLPLYIKDTTTYNNIKLYKMLYLRYLAGF